MWSSHMGIEKVNNVETSWKPVLRYKKATRALTTSIAVSSHHNYITTQLVFF